MSWTSSERLMCVQLTSFVQRGEAWLGGICKIRAQLKGGGRRALPKSVHHCFSVVTLGKMRRSKEGEGL